MSVVALQLLHKIISVRKSTFKRFKLNFSLCKSLTHCLQIFLQTAIYLIHTFSKVLSRGGWLEEHKLCAKQKHVGSQFTKSV